MFKALMLEEKDGKVASSIQDVDEARLPEGDVTVAVTHSTLNYKDGLILLGQGRLVRQYPHIPGVDFAGTVLESANPAYKAGDPVILTGWRVGENRWGGYAAKARVKGEWLVPMPKGLDAKRAMAIGTAGFTSMLSVIALQEHGMRPENGPVLITGAAGGVGSVATAILARLGYQVVCSTGRAEAHDYLKSLGAAEIIPRSAVEQPSGRPLESEKWAGAIDSVGGQTLAAILPMMMYHASIASCGLAGGAKFEATVIPFLLRGVNILGIDSVLCPTDRRRTAWARLARELPFDKLDAMTETVKLADLPALAPKILEGKVRGRIVVETR
ncbi:MAG TPA: MDR family oxidoreductase [Dongiaceae bacterium]|jgi:acrylyl-CoA reductase (NADPH)|nr:MDR family oxidoreductase [Dongiaceae bacterium]